MSDAFVYLLLDPLNDYIPFYVGKGSNVSRRAKNRPSFHLLEAMKGKRSAKCDRIRAIVAAGETYAIQIWKDVLTEEEAYDLETDLIERFGREHYENDGVLTNILADNRRINYTKIVYLKGPDHHSYGVERPREHIERQRASWRARAQHEGFYHCKCGCGIEVSWAQRNYAANSRQKHMIADWHLNGLPHNYARSRKIKLLLQGMKEEQIFPEMYLNKQVFNNITES